MAVPTVISGLYGMDNGQSDGMPFAYAAAGFAIVLALTLALCVFAAWVAAQKAPLCWQGGPLPKRNPTKM